MQFHGDVGKRYIRWEYGPVVNTSKSRQLGGRKSVHVRTQPLPVLTRLRPRSRPNISVLPDLHMKIEADSEVGVTTAFLHKKLYVLRISTTTARVRTASPLPEV